MDKKTALIIIAASLALASCGSGWREPDALNNDGISLFLLKKYDEAGTRFEESISYRFKSEIPAYNMGNNCFRKGDYISAHEYYQKALRRDPVFCNAVFNDGCALYMQGMSILDTEYCDIAVTISYLKNARERFLDSAEMDSAGGALGEMSRKNADFVTAKIDEIEKKHLENGGRCGTKGNEPGGSVNPDDGSNIHVSKKRPDPGSDYGGSSLSGSEKEKVKTGLERIRRESSEACFRQTEAQQIRRGSGKENSAKGGELLSW